MKAEKRVEVAEQSTYDIRVKATLISTEEYGEFMSFTSVTKQGKKCQIKFRQEVKVPNKEGFYMLKVNKKDINRDNSSAFNVFWVKAAISFTPEEEIENDEELPF